MMNQARRPPAGAREFDPRQMVEIWKSRSGREETAITPAGSVRRIKAKAMNSFVSTCRIFSQICNILTLIEANFKAYIIVIP
jgi:hypothetical protein